MTSIKVTKALPRILCIHGSGGNAEVFRMQARALTKQLNNDFRFVFADGPFRCGPGPGIVPTYEEHGPFWRWLRWMPKDPEIEAEIAVDEIWYKLNEAMEEDDLEGETGPWVGLLGFSQGAKLCASLLFEQQYRNQLRELGKNTDADDAKPNFKFAVLMAATAPLVSMRQETDSFKALVTVGEISEGFEAGDTETDEHVLRLPTVHVHGLQDGVLYLHRRMLHQYCDPLTSSLVEWDGGHSIPLKSTDVQRVTDLILDVAKNAGVI